jgi:hypothetical protein
VGIIFLLDRYSLTSFIACGLILIFSENQLAEIIYLSIIVIIIVHGNLINKLINDDIINDGVLVLLVFLAISIYFHWSMKMMIFILAGNVLIMGTKIELCLFTKFLPIAKEPGGLKPKWRRQLAELEDDPRFSLSHDPEDDEYALEIFKKTIQQLSAES